MQIGRIYSDAVRVTDRVFDTVSASAPGLITLALANGHVPFVIAPSTEARVSGLNPPYESNASRDSGVALAEKAGRDWQVCTIMSAEDFSTSYPESAVTWRQRNSGQQVQA